MSRKISLILAMGLLQFAVTHSQSSPSDLSIPQQIQIKMFNFMNKRQDFLWKATSLEQNVQFIPLSMEVSMCIGLLKYYYEDDAVAQYPKNEFLKIICSVINITDSWQKSSNVKLEMKNAIFYEQESTPQRFLDDAKTYFHADLYSVLFDPTNKVAFSTSINEWIANHTEERAYELNTLVREAKNYVQLSLLSFTACWDKPKTSVNSIKMLNFKTPENDIEVESFNSKETIGYYNNSELKYEAIRLPYKNNEFAMIIVLPYPDRSLQSISEFSFDQYSQLFRNIRTNKQNIDYVIPTMSSSVFSLNENGTGVHGEDPIICDSFSAQQTLTLRDDNTKINYKPFYVDRPFDLLIYNEKTKYILVHSWVKNPTSNFSNPDTHMQWNLFITYI